MSLKIHKCAKLLTRVDREHQPFDGNWTREKTGQVISDQLVDQDHQKVNRSWSRRSIPHEMRWNECLHQAYQSDRKRNFLTVRVSKGFFFKLRGLTWKYMNWSLECSYHKKVIWTQRTQVVVRGYKKQRERS
jgi:hypothetical protein